MAELYHIPPWQLVDECTEEWWQYMKLYNNLRSKAHG